MAAIRRLATNAIEIDALGTRSARRTLSTTRRAVTRLNGVVRPSTATWTGGRARGAGTSPFRRLFGCVRPDDIADEPMTNHVRFVEIMERDAVDTGQDALDLRQSRFLIARQVDLRLVAGDHHLRVQPEPGEEHLHLHRRRVLRF